jgi:hypothetical protein
MPRSPVRFWQSLTVPQSIFLSGLALAIALFFALRDRSPAAVSTPADTTATPTAPAAEVPAASGTPQVAATLLQPASSPSFRPPTEPASEQVQARATDETTKALAKHRALMIERCVIPLGKGVPPTEILFRVLIDPNGRELGPRGVRDTHAEPRFEMVRCLVKLHAQTAVTISPPGHDLAVLVRMKLP